MNLVENFKRARRAGTPIIAINCFDPEACISQLQFSLNGKTESTPVIQWDSIRGWLGRNDAGLKAVLKLTEEDGVEATKNPITQLEMAINLPESSILFLVNSQHWLTTNNAGVNNYKFAQAIWNLRDEFKSNNRTLVLLATSLSIPSELQQDILVLDEELPNDEVLEAIVNEILEAAEISETEEKVSQAVDALRGLSAFPAEQSLALSISKKGIDIKSLWERKRQVIKATPGLSVWDPKFGFESIGGCEELKARFTRILNGKRAPRVIIWIDEIEKAMGMGTMDTSGTSQDQLGVLLTEMQEREYSGSIFVGVPGTAKSAFAKAIAGEAGTLLIKLDLGEMKGQFVGLSEERIRAAMKIVRAVAGEQGAFFIATSNDIRAIRPELKRRFKKGIWFFDLPTEEEKSKIWQIHCSRYGMEIPQDTSFDSGWTGAEIETCVSTAWEEDIDFSEAAKTIIPVSVSGAQDVERLREEAAGKYNSVSYTGAYQLRESALLKASSQVPQKRRIELQD